MEQEIKQILKKGLRDTFNAGYTAKNKDEALDNLAENLGNDIITYVDAKISEINEQEGMQDLHARSVLKSLIAELQNQTIVMGTNLNPNILTNLKNEL